MKPLLPASAVMVEKWRAISTNNVAGLMWHLDTLDKDLELELLNRNITTGTFLDLGCGHGSQSNILQQMGFQVTGTDISDPMLAYAKNVNSKVTYINDDILNTNLDTKFDYVFDRGCFHLFHEDERSQYVEKVHGLVKNLLFLKASSDKNKVKGMTPVQFSEDVLVNVFSERFNILEIRHGTFSDKVTKEQLIALNRHTTVKSIFFVLEPRNF